MTYEKEKREKNPNVLRLRVKKRKNDITVYGAQWNYDDDLKEPNLGEGMDCFEEKNL